MGAKTFDGIPVKVVELIHYMKANKAALMCLQETHVPGSAYYEVDGYSVILSGSEGAESRCAGVGFIVAPRLKKAVVSFCQYSPRLASIRIRVTGGCAVFISSYAPHSGHSFEDRSVFYTDLEAFAEKQKTHGPTYILGDMNARLHRRAPDEIDILGPNVFGNPAATFSSSTNRSLLLSLCRSLQLFIVNTAFSHDASKLVTYYDIGSHPTSALDHKNFGQLDFILVGTEWLDSVQDAYSDRNVGFSSHHFPVLMDIRSTIPKMNITRRQVRLGVQELKKGVSLALE